MQATIETAKLALNGAQAVVNEITAHFARICNQGGKISLAAIDAHQVPLVELVQLATQVLAAQQLLAHAANQTGDRPAVRLVQALALHFAAETARQAQQQTAFREAAFGLTAVPAPDPTVHAFLQTWLAPQKLSETAVLIHQTNSIGADGLNDEHRELQATIRRFAAAKIAPLAEHIHRHDELLPDEMIAGLAELGCFGLSIPARYGGFQEDGRPDHLAMVIVSDELSRASFGTAGSLITRPELLAKALLNGGTEAQKQKWLPLIANGRKQAAVAITEPDFGSDVAHLTTMAQRVEGGWRLNGRKTWCTFAGRADILMVLARTDPDMAKAHRGLSLFIVEKPADYGYEFEHVGGDGRLSGRAITTIGYRGMHSFELVLDDWFVPDENLIGGDAGLGRGFYLQMQGFSGSRLQTAGRALGIMTAAFETGLTYAGQRKVFGRKLLNYPLTQNKLVRMAMHIQAARQLTYHAAREVDKGRGSTEAAMAKLLTARAAEWVAREAQQLHGGMGYAEEFPISRHFVDARVLAIFEGAEEVLALRVIARALLNRE